MDCTPTKKGFRRLQALLWFYEGKTHQEITTLAHFSERQILRYMQAFNSRGPDGLIPGRSSGRPRAVSRDEMKVKIMPLVDEPSKANQSHWTAVKLHGWIKDTLQIELGYSITVRYLHEHDYRLMVPHPRPLNQDEEARQAFCEKLQSWQKDESIDLWFSDESGIEGDPRPRRQWTKIGSVRTSPYLGEHIRHNVFGAVRPKDGRLSQCSSTTVMVKHSKPSLTPWLRRILQLLVAEHCW